MQELDTLAEFGKRNILLSSAPKLLEGFPLSMNNPLEKFLVSPVRFSLSKPDLSAEITLPEIVPGINFRPVEKYAYCSLVVSLGVAPDYWHDPHKYKPSSPEYDQVFPKITTTEWFPSAEGAGEKKITLKVDATVRDENFVLVLGVCIRFGTPITQEVVQQAKFGAAKIIGVV